jgi:hypothetical protein
MSGSYLVAVFDTGFVDHLDSATRVKVFGISGELLFARRRICVLCNEMQTHCTRIC